MLLMLVGTYAYSVDIPPFNTIPNPGHKVGEIQGYFEGDTSLEDTIDKLCQSDGSNCGGGVIGGGYASESSTNPPLGCDSWGEASCHESCSGPSGCDAGVNRLVCNRGKKILTGARDGWTQDRDADTFFPRDIGNGDETREYYICVV